MKNLPSGVAPFARRAVRIRAACPRSFVICPINVEVNTNIIYMEGILPVVFELLVDLTQMAVIYISYAFLLETLFRQGLRRALPIAGIYIGAVVFGAAANLVMDVTLHGGGEYVDIMLLSAVSGIVQELAQICLVLLTAALLARRGGSMAVPTKIFSLQNRVQRAALIAAGITCVFRVGARLIYDITYGMPTSAGELVEMISSYGTDVIIPFLGYLTMVLILMRHPDPVETGAAESATKEN